MTNVQPGQLAMFKPGSGENAGRVVSVVGPSPDLWLLHLAFPELNGPWWTVRALQRIARFQDGNRRGDFMPGETLQCPDHVLMPLHDGDGQDESLNWTARPTFGEPVHQLIEEHAGA